MLKLATQLLFKRRDIIPEVVEVVKEERTGQEKDFIFPKVCPECGSHVIRPKMKLPCAVQEVWPVQPKFGRYNSFCFADARILKGLAQK